jgi:hypothetical protein
MIRKMSTFRALFSFAIVFVLALAVFGDTIRLKDGSLIKGTIVSFSDGRFVVAVGEGARRREITILADEVASVEFEPIAGPLNSRVDRPVREPKIVPVSTKPAPKVVVTETAKAQPEAEDAPPVVKRNEPASSAPTRNTAPPVSQRPAVSRPAGQTSAAVPIGLSVRVLADNTANGWTNSGYVVKKGQVVRITGSGKISLGRGQSATPSGLPDLEDEQKLLKAVPTGALLAVIGDDNNDFIYIGSSREFTAGRDGALYLGVNEGNLNDNSGAFDVKIEIVPDGGP